MPKIPKLETLPEDGASYRCCYGFTLYEDWRCSKEAVGAIPHGELDRCVRELGKHGVLHARALCALHAFGFGLMP